MRLGDLDALKEMVNKIKDTDYGSIFDYTAHREVRNVLRDIKHLIDNAPTIEAEPVRHGVWIWDEANECYICSVCGEAALNNYRGLSVASNGCPHCRAKMKGDRNA